MTYENPSNALPKESNIQNLLDELKAKDEMILSLQERLMETKERLASKEAAQVSEMGITANSMELLLENLKGLIANKADWQKLYDEFVDKAMIKYLEADTKLKAKYPHGAPIDEYDVEIYLEEKIIDPKGLEIWTQRFPEQIMAIERWIAINPESAEEITRMIGCRTIPKQADNTISS